MESVLRKQRASETINASGINGNYGRSYGAGMYGAFYSPRAAARAEKHQLRVEKSLIESNDFLGDIKDNIKSTLKMLTQQSLGIKSREDLKRGKGKLSSEDRDMILEQLNGTKNGNKTFKTTGQAISSAASNKLAGLAYKFSSRGISDLLLGKPVAGGIRDTGRKYEDALKQYTKDRMMLQGKDLIKTYGKDGAKDQIAKDFKEQQKIKREINKTNTEVERRRNIGMTGADIDSKEGGFMIKKLNDLLDNYAKHDPTNTGRYLESKDINPDTVKGKVPAGDRFNANTTVYKDPSKPDNLNPKSSNVQDVPFKMSEEDKLKADVIRKEDIEETKKQTGLLEKIAEALKVKKDENSGYSDGKPDTSFWEKLLSPLGFIKELFVGITSIFSTVGTFLSGLLPLLGSISAILIPLTAAVSLLTLGKMQKDKIEQNPYAPEMKDNAYAMQLRDEVVSVTQGTKVNQQKALRNLPPGTAKELMGLEPDANGLRDGYTEEQLTAMSKGEKPKNLTPVPLEIKAKADVAKMKPVLSNSSAKVDTATAANGDAKRQMETAPITVVAPTTVNNSAVNNGTRNESMGPVRNQESTISKYLSSRYQTN